MNLIHTALTASQLPSRHYYHRHGQALYALDKGDVWEAYQLYLQAGLYSAAHDIAVLQLAPEAVIRDDLELLESIFVEFTGRPVEGWHVRGKVSILPSPLVPVPPLY